MTEEKKTPLAKPASETNETEPTGGAAVFAVDETYYVVVAQFPDTAAAREAYDDLRRLEQTSTLRIDGVVVAHRGNDGKVTLEKMTEHSTRTGLKWGVAGGIVVGALFPPSILASAVAVGGFGALLGKIRNMNKRSDLTQELGDALAPNTSGIVALVEDQAAVEVKRALAKADRIVSKAVDRAVAMQIDAEAEAAKQEAGV